MRKPNFLILKLCAAALAALLSVATSHALLIDVKALYSDRYSIESVEVTNLANGASVTLEPGQTLALDSAEPRTADVRLPFVDGDDVRFTARATDGEVTVITERPDDDHTVWVHFINTLDSSGRRHTVHKIGGLYYITKGANPDALVNKSWHRPTADDLKATSDYFNNTKVRGLYFEKRLPQAGTLRRGMRAFTADTDADNDGVIEIDEGDPTIEDPAFDLSDASVSREREANHRAMVATMLGFDPDLVQPITPKPLADGPNQLNYTEKMIALPGMNFTSETGSFGQSASQGLIGPEITFSNADTEPWDLVVTKPYNAGNGIEYNMTLYGKRGKDLQLVIYKPNRDGSFTELQRFSFADHLNYAKYEDSNWGFLSKISEADWYSQCVSYLHNRRYMRIQAAEAETSLCQAGQYVFVFQGNHVTKLNVATGDISTSTLSQVPQNDNNRTCWTSVVFDFNDDGYDDVLAFADDNNSDKLYSVATYGSESGYSDSYIEQMVCQHDSYRQMYMSSATLATGTAVDAKIVYANGSKGNPYLYLALVPVGNRSYFAPEHSMMYTINNTAHFAKIELTGDRRDVWDGTKTETAQMCFNMVSDTKYANGGKAVDGMYEFYWKAKIDPVYNGGLHTGIAPLIATNWNRIYSSDMLASNVLFPVKDVCPNLVDAHIDQFSDMGEDLTIPKPAGAFVRYHDETLAELVCVNYNCEFSELATTGFDGFQTKTYVRLKGSEGSSTGFASVPFRNKEGVVLKYAGCEITASNPTIYNILAAPPFNEYTATDGGSGAASYCTVSKTTSSEEERSSSESLRVGISSSLTFLEIFKIGADVTLTEEWSKAFRTSTSKTYMQDFRVDGPYDAVNFSFVPCDKYCYKVESSDNPSIEVGTMMYIYNLREEQPRYTTWRLNTYNERLYGTGLPTIDNNILPHEPGNIGSYRRIKPNFTASELCSLFKISESDLVGYTPTNINPGDAGGSTVEITIESGNGLSAGHTVSTDVEVSFGVTMAEVFELGVKEGVSTSDTWTRSDSWSQSTTMGGTVPSVKNVDYQYQCRQVFYRYHLKDEQGRDLQDCLVNNWVVIGNEGSSDNLVPELAINKITRIEDGTYAVDLKLYGRKDVSSAAPGLAADRVPTSNLGLDHFMLENTIDGKVWHDANTTIEGGVEKKENFDLSNDGAYDQYEASRDFEHDYLYLTNEQLAQLEEYSAGRSSTPVIATYKLTVSDAVGNKKSATAEVEIPKMVTTGIEDLTAEPALQATASGSIINVSGAAPESEVYVCDLTGRVVATAQADSRGNARIAAAPRGVVIVTNATGNVKLTVR